MNPRTKRTLVIISLIISILTLIWLIIAHYDLHRKFMLKNMGYEYFLKKYRNLPKSESRIVLVFSLDESDLKKPEKTKTFINSILDQTLRVDEISLNIDSKLRSKLPKELEKILSIYPQSKKYEKSVRGIIPAVLTEINGNTKILVVEPCGILEKDFVETFSQNIDKKIVLKKGFIGLKPEFFDDNIRDAKSLEDLLSKSKVEIMKI